MLSSKAICLLQQCVFVTAVLEYLWVSTKAVRMVTIHTAGFNVVHCNILGHPLSQIKLLNHPFMMVLIYVIAHNFHTGMLQFGMVHASQVWFPQHENIALQIKSQPDISAGKIIALICTNCNTLPFVIFSTAYVNAYCSFISSLTVLLNSTNLHTWRNSAPQFIIWNMLYFIW